MDHSGGIGSSVLLPVLVFLAAAALLVPLLRRLGIPGPLAWMAAGVMLGPYGIGQLAQRGGELEDASMTEWAAAPALGEFGLMFLLLTLGLELSWPRLKRLGPMVIGMGLGQMVLAGAGAALAARGFGLPFGPALLLGVPLAFSSTAIVLQGLAEARRSGTPAARAAVAVLLFQDLAVPPVLLLPELLAEQEKSPLGALGLALGAGIAASLVIVLVGRIVLRPLFRLVAETRSSEMFVAAILLVAIGTAEATAAIGLTAALGAFLAGMLIADTEYRHQVDADIAPFKGLLLGLFFMGVGAGLDLGLVVDQPVLLLGGTLALMLGKALVAGLVARVAGLPTGTAIEVGLLLSQAGEFSLAALTLARNQGGIDPATVAPVMAIVVLSMALTPFAARLAHWVAKRLEHQGALKDGAADEPDEMEGHVVIAGFGRVGRTVAKVLAAEGVAYVALDLDAAAVNRARESGEKVFYGDARRLETLRRVRIEQAAALCLTLDDPAAVRVALAAMRSGGHSVPVFARARDVEQARLLGADGAAHAVPETLEGALRLAAGSLEAAGFDAGAAEAAVGRARERALPANGARQPDGDEVLAAP